MPIELEYLHVEEIEPPNTQNQDVALGASAAIVVT